MPGEVRSPSNLDDGSIYRRLVRNFAYLGTGTIASAMFMMLALVLSARALSPAAFGVLILFQSATLMVAAFMSFATQQPILKLGATALADGDKARLGRIIGLGLLLDALAALAAAIGSFAFLALAGPWLAIELEQWQNAAPFAASLLFSGYLTANGIFRLLDRFGLLSLIQAGCAAALLGAMACLTATRAPFGAYCWTWAIFYVLNSQLPLIAALHLARRARIPVALHLGRMKPGEVRTFLAYCWTTWGMASIEAIRINGDSLLVGAAVSIEAAGAYNVAKQLAGVLRKFNAVYASAAFPEISAMSAHGEEDGARRIRRRILRLSAALGTIAVVAALLLGRPALRLLFGVHFESAWMPLVILTGAAAAQLVSHTLSMYVQVAIGPKHLFHLYVLALLPFLIAVVPLTWALTTTGTALAQLLFALLLIFHCQRALGARDAQ
ncbi:lipopolysaccharide biosynthesis protein [Sphingomonas sp. URHD0057]|uniref:lipopolysaccharide biosynthesis protein n=1 Tax=Sphingomonas sp. URHD0057 TaxID=1380389 RepID=UPI00048AD22B|nr:lipopolysaccharide biosynthesis protein [Sphingomonas sp. URHD0057]